MTTTKPQTGKTTVVLPILRCEIGEAARILRLSRSSLYNRIQEGSIRRQKDGKRTYITRAELERYIESCQPAARRTAARSSHRKARRDA